MKIVPGTVAKSWPRLVHRIRFQNGIKVIEMSAHRAA
jgi:hypothetical protein